MITGVPQYYGVAPWVYPANIIQQGTTNGARRPLTPSGTQEQPQVQGGYIVPYYDQNAPILMAQGNHFFFKLNEHLYICKKNV